MPLPTYKKVVYQSIAYRLGSTATRPRCRSESRDTRHLPKMLTKRASQAIPGVAAQGASAATTTAPKPTLATQL